MFCDTSDLQSCHYSLALWFLLCACFSLSSFLSFVFYLLSVHLVILPIVNTDMFYVHSVCDVLGALPSEFIISVAHSCRVLTTNSLCVVACSDVHINIGLCVSVSYVF